MSAGGEAVARSPSFAFEATKQQSPSNLKSRRRRRNGRRRLTACCKISTIVCTLLFTFCSGDPTSVAPTTDIPSSVATAAASGPSGSPGYCLVSPSEEASDYCVPLHTAKQVVVGHACMTIDPFAESQADKLSITFKTSGIWALVETKLWVGHDLASAPTDQDPNSRFPYYWCSSSGNSTWEVMVDLPVDNQLCKTSTIIPFFGISKILVGRRFGNGTLVPLTEEYAQAAGNSSSLNHPLGAFPMSSVDCACTRRNMTDLIVPPHPAKLSQCIQRPDLSHRKCFDLSSSNAVSVGETCLEVNATTKTAEVTFNTRAPWKLIEGKLWVGESLLKAPLMGHPFPYFWHTSGGEEMHKVSIEIPQTEHCVDNEYRQMFAKAQVRVGRTLLNSSLIESTEELAWVRATAADESHGHGMGHQSKGAPKGIFDFLLFDSCNSPPNRTNQTQLTTQFAPPNTPTPGISEKLCYSLVSDEMTRVGTVCLVMVGSPPLLEVSFRTHGLWRLLSTKLWIGLPTMTPPASDVVATAGNYPYYWCNSTGEEQWQWKIPINETRNCLESQSFQLQLVAHAEVSRAFVNGTLIKETKEKASVLETVSAAVSHALDFWVTCGNTRHSFGVMSVQPHACLDAVDETGKMCYSLETSRGLHTGSICIEMQQHQSALQVSYSSAVSWSLIKGDFWAGFTLRDLPLAENNAPGLATFPNYWSDSSGQSHWNTMVDVNIFDICESRGRSKLYAVAHAVVAQVSRNGTLLAQTNQSVYATSFSGHPSVDHPGWIEIPIKCPCSQAPPPTGDDEPNHRAFELMESIATNAIHNSEGKDNADVCFSSPEGSLLKCFTLLVAGRTAAGSLCLEVDEKLSYLTVTFKAISNVWALIRNALWIGSSSQEPPKADLDDPLPEGFHSIRYNSSGEASWTTTLPLNATSYCADQDAFELVVLAQSIVGRIDGNGSVLKSPRHTAFAVGPSNATHGYSNGFGLSFKCDCTKSKSRRLRELELFPQEQQKLLHYTTNNFPSKASRVNLIT